MLLQPPRHEPRDSDSTREPKRRETQPLLAAYVWQLRGGRRGREDGELGLRSGVDKGEGTGGGGDVRGEFKECSRVMF